MNTSFEFFALSSRDKEKYLYNVFPGIKNSPICIEPSDFFTIETNGVIDATILSELVSLTSEIVENGCLIFLNDDNNLNAYATVKDNIKFIGVTTGTIKKILYCSNIIMLSNQFLPRLGDSDACFQNVKAKDYSIEDDAEGNLSMYLSGDPVREITGYIVANIAILFIIFHELGHHAKGHINMLNSRFGLTVNDAANTCNNCLSHEDRKKVELEADLFAIKKIMDDIEPLLEAWGKKIEIELSYTEAVDLIIAALVIVKENLSADVYFANDIEKSDYLPNMVRITILIACIALNEKFKTPLLIEVASMLKDDDELQSTLQHSGIQAFNEYGELNEQALACVIGLIYVKFEQIYCSVFKSSKFSTAVALDLCALEWFQNLQ